MSKGYSPARCGGGDGQQFPKKIGAMHGESKTKQTPLLTATQLASDRVDNTARVPYSWSGTSYHKGTFCFIGLSFSLP